MKTIPFDEFCEKYKPIKNPFNPDAAHDGYMFETFGAEYDFVKDIQMRPNSGRFNYNRVITIMDDESLRFGYHLVNRLGYIILGVPFVTGGRYGITGTSFTFGD